MREEGIALEKALLCIDERQRTYIEQLKSFIRIPSVSTGADEDTSDGLAQAADFLVGQFDQMGFEVEKIQVRAATNPLVVARSPAFSSDRPTVLIYGHYDVQGVDNPRSAWEVDPFAAEERDGFLIARGASDNKGPCFAHLKAAEVVFANGNQLPFNLVFLIEGEEECGSAALSQFVAEGGLDEFAPVLCTVISDTSMYGPDQPSLTVGLRGIVYTEVEVFGPVQDVHSGLFGGIVHNPNQLLVNALSGLIDAEGRICCARFLRRSAAAFGPRKKPLRCPRGGRGCLLPHLGRALAGGRAGVLHPRKALDSSHARHQPPQRRQSAHRHTGCSPSGHLLPISARPKSRTHPSGPRRTHPRSSARRHSRRVQKPALLTGLLLGPRPSTSRADT